MDVTTPLMSWFKSAQKEKGKHEKEEERKSQPRIDDVFPIQKLVGEAVENTFNRAFRFDPGTRNLGIAATEFFLVQVVKHPTRTFLENTWFASEASVCLKVGVDENLALVTEFSKGNVAYKDWKTKKLDPTEKTPHVCIYTKMCTVRVMPRNGWSCFELKERLVELLFP